MNHEGTRRDCKLWTDVADLRDQQHMQRSKGVKREESTNHKSTERIQLSPNMKKLKMQNTLQREILY
jgi:hypothetical protein